METTSTAEQGRTTERMGATTPTTFGAREVCHLAQLSQATLKSWILKGWIRPVWRSRGGRGRENQFSAWQTLGIAILSAANRSAEQAFTFVGRVGVVRAMEILAGLDDSWLLAES